MSLTKEQQRELEKLSEKLRKIERLSVSNDIDLDVYMTNYKEGGFEVYATEKISLEQTQKRKQLLENREKEKATTKKA